MREDARRPARIERSFVARDSVVVIAVVVVVAIYLAGWLAGWLAYSSPVRCREPHAVARSLARSSSDRVRPFSWNRSHFDDSLSIVAKNNIDGSLSYRSTGTRTGRNDCDCIGASWFTVPSAASECNL